MLAILEFFFLDKPYRGRSCVPRN